MPDFALAGHLERRRLEPVDAQHGEVVARVEGDRLGGAGPAPRRARSTRVSSWPGDHVGVGHHDARRGHPAGALDADAARGAEDLDHAVARRGHLRVARDRRPRRRHARLGSVDPRERVERAQRVEQRAGRRQHRVELAQDRRALDVAPDVGPRLQRHRAEHPGDRAARRRRSAPRPARRRPPRRPARRTWRAVARPPPRSSRPARRRPRARRSARRPAPTATRCRPPAPAAPARVPSHAPAAKPASARTPARKPCAQPNRASSTTAPRMTQSMPVMPRRWSWKRPSVCERTQRVRSPSYP